MSRARRVRAVYRRERFILLKGRKPVAELRPVASGVRLGKLEETLRGLPRLSPEEADAFAADLDAARNELPPGR